MISGCFSNKKEDSGYDIVWKLKDIINEEIIDAIIKSSIKIMNMK